MNIIYRDQVKVDFKVSSTGHVTIDVPVPNGHAVRILDFQAHLDLNQEGANDTCVMGRISGKLPANGFTCAGAMADASTVNLVIFNDGLDTAGTVSGFKGGMQRGKQLVEDAVVPEKFYIQLCIPNAGVLFTNMATMGFVVEIETVKVNAKIQSLLLENLF